jgi:F420H(2)-dependent quinone reductase
MDGLSIQRSPLANSPSLMKRQPARSQRHRARLWDVAVAAFPPYAEYQRRTTRKIPVFVAEPAR